jgi:hypothetical protein
MPLVAFLCALLFLAAAGWVLKEGGDLNGREMFTIAVGAALGSISAAVLQWLAQLHDSRQRQRASLTIAQGALMHQLQMLQRIRAEVFEPHRKNSLRTILIPGMLMPPIKLHVRYEDLTWLAAELEAEVVNGVADAEQFVEQFMAAMERRSQLIDPRHHGGVTVLLDGRIRITDPLRIEELIHLTNLCYNRIDVAICALSRAINVLHDQAKRRWWRALRYHVPNDEMEPMPAVLDTPDARAFDDQQRKALIPLLTR